MYCVLYGNAESINQGPDELWSCIHTQFSYLHSCREGGQMPPGLVRWGLQTGQQMGKDDYWQRCTKEIVGWTTFPSASLLAHTSCGECDEQLSFQHMVRGSVGGGGWQEHSRMMMPFWGCRIYHLKDKEQDKIFSSKIHCTRDFETNEIFLNKTASSHCRVLQTLK